MSRIILPSKRLAQPTGPVELDWSNPIVQAMRPVYIYHPAAGMLYDAVSRSNRGDIQQTPTIQPTRFGVGLNSPTGTQHFIRTGIYVDSSFTFLSIWSYFQETPASATPGYTHGGMHDGTRRFYVASYNDQGTYQRICGWGGGVIVANGSVIPAGESEMLTMVKYPSSLVLYRNGEAYVSGTSPTFTGTSTRQIYLGKRTLNSGTEDGSVVTGQDNTVLLAVVGKGAPSAEAVREFYRAPWQIFKPVTRRIYFDVGGSSTTVALDGAALAVATASGTLTTGIPLSGVAVSTSAASGGLTAQITLAGSALAQAVSSALLSSGITMTAAAVVQAAASGTLVTAIQMIGAAQAQSGASGSLTTGSGGLEGSAQASASASASLSAQIRLSGTAIANAAASGSLSGSANLAGAAVSTTSASGTLTVNIALTAQALASTIAQGSLTAQIQLNADAAAVAQAGAELFGGSALIVPDVVQIISAPAGRQHRPGYLYGHRHGIKIGS